MEQYIKKAAVAAKIANLQATTMDRDGNFYTAKAQAEYNVLCMLENFLDHLEVKEVEECKQPEYSCLETIYQCGKKPHWNIGDTLVYYEFYSDREGECGLGKVTKVEFDEEQCEWFYTFENGNVYDEQSLLEEQTYTITVRRTNL